MKIFDVLNQLITDGKIKYSDSLTIEVRGDFKFEIQKASDCVRLVMTGTKQIYAVTNFGHFAFAIDGIKFYPDKYIIEVQGWTDPILNYPEGM